MGEGQDPPLDRYYARVRRTGRWWFTVTLHIDTMVDLVQPPFRSSGQYSERRSVFGQHRAERVAERKVRRANRRLDQQQAYGDRVVTDA